ncbi:hypothetical protein ACP4OV_003877 [Aristida adscensionis]
MVAEAAPSSAIWSRRRDEITFDRLHKFWSALSPRARHELLRLDKQSLIEHARKNLYCSRCNGLLLESFTQIVTYGKSQHQEGSCEPKFQEVEAEEVQDPSVHPWGGLSTTKDGILTLLDCFINAKSLHVLQNVFDHARGREREREMLYPDACGGSGRGWISPVIPNYGRGHGTRDTCALHTARLSCDTLVDFWSALSEETRSSLLRMKEEDFIERLMHRFDSKRFCRDCRRNVIREFKELKELKRMRREPRCTSWFCVADTAFQCEVFEDAVVVDWHQSFLEQDGSYHHFEWAVGTDEGKSDILGFENVGMNGQAHRKGLDLDQFEDYFVTLRAWKLDGRCTEFCVKAHALKGQSCVHRRLIVGDGYVTITKGESIRSFFEHAEEAEEDDEEDAVDRDGNDPDGDGAHPQKHAKSPELAREFLLDAAAVIFKEQVEKAFREGTARQNAHSVFVSLALKLLEERIHVACKEIITLEKQTKLLEEEEKEKREEEERRERRRTKEREKKHRRKERLKGKDRDKERTQDQSNVSDETTPSSQDVQDLGASTNNQSQDIQDSRYSDSEEEDNDDVRENYSPDTSVDQSSSRDIDEQSNEHQCDTTAEFVHTDCSGSFTCEQSKSSRRNMRFRRNFPQDQHDTYWYEDCQDDSGDIGDIQRQSRDRIRNNIRGYNSVFSKNNRARDRYNPCSCGHQEDSRYFSTAARSSREVKIARRTMVEKPRLQYRRCYPMDSLVSKGGRIGPKQVWEPMDARKKASLGNANNTDGTADDANQSNLVECSKDINVCEKLDTGSEQHAEVCSSQSEEACKSDTDQPCKEGEKDQAASADEVIAANKPDCCLTRDAGIGTNLPSSDSSSCLSEGDRDSSMSSMTSLSAQNAESSSTSDSEESSERNNVSPGGDPPTKNGTRSLLEVCVGNGFREFQPQSIQASDSNKMGFGTTAPFQDKLLPHQNVHAPPFSSSFMGFHNHPLPVPTSAFVPYPQPGHFYPGPMGPVGYGVPANQRVNFPMQFSSVHPYPGSEFGCVPVQPVQKTPVSFHAMPPTPPYRNGVSLFKGSDGQKSHALPPIFKEVEPQSDCPEEIAKRKNERTPFSLFQFNLPIGCPVLAVSEDEQSGGALASTPPTAPAQTCSREETDIKEYNLFSAGSGGLFPFI